MARAAATSLGGVGRGGVVVPARRQPARPRRCDPRPRPAAHPVPDAAGAAATAELLDLVDGAGAGHARPRAAERRRVGAARRAGAGSDARRQAGGHARAPRRRARTSRPQRRAQALLAREGRRTRARGGRGRRLLGAGPLRRRRRRSRDDRLGPDGRRSDDVRRRRSRRSPVSAPTPPPAIAEHLAPRRCRRVRRHGRSRATRCSPACTPRSSAATRDAVGGLAAEAARRGLRGRRRGPSRSLGDAATRRARARGRAARCAADRTGRARRRRRDDGARPAGRRRRPLRSISRSPRRSGSPARAAVLLAAGTDGVDGPTDAAGACVDGETVARARAAGLDAAGGARAPPTAIALLAAHR